MTDEDATEDRRGRAEVIGAQQVKAHVHSETGLRDAR